MKIEEGPAFSGLVIGGGIGFLLYNKTQNLPLAMAVGFLVGVTDYALILLVRRFTNKG
jgi:F0F1-type ATP synthase assembly protein I